MFTLGLKLATAVNGINQNTDVKALIAKDVSFTQLRKGIATSLSIICRKSFQSTQLVLFIIIIIMFVLTGQPTAINHRWFGVRTAAGWQTWITTRKSARKTNKGSLQISILKRLFNIWWPLAWIKIRGKHLLGWEGRSAWTAYVIGK